MPRKRSAPKARPGPSPIVVAGDVVVDHHVYEGERHTASAFDRRGIKVIREHGGASGLYKLIEQVLQRAIDVALLNGKKAPESDWAPHFALTKPELNSIPCGHHALSVWKPVPRKPDSKREDKVWRAKLLMGYGHDEPMPAHAGGFCPSHQPEVAALAPPPARLLVLDDAGFIFRHRNQKSCWLLSPSQRRRPGWIILKMSGPVCTGDLWERIAKTQARRLIVVVSAQDLRQECVRLGAGLSWERTVEELREALKSSPVLRKLASVPRHTVVTFSADGALWLDNRRGGTQATLVFDTAGAEGAWERPLEGHAFGYLSCMVASMTRAIMHNPKEPEFAPAIRAGLSAMRDLLECGHGPVGETLPDGFPVQRLAEVIVRGAGDFSTLRVPWTDKEWSPYATRPTPSSRERPWRIVEMSQCPFGSRKLPSLVGLATQVVLQGELAIKGLPHARFGELLTADRFEIESLRTIERAVLDYKRDEQAKRPLSLGVFGPPGAGKSFGVRQIANAVFGKESWLEFNLSQFKDEDDLIGAFHQVRDTRLSGATPVVFWDEFDSREYFWLQYLLAPMQDGRFQERQVNHYIGKCVFILAGATSFAYDEFGPAKPGTRRFDDAAWKQFVLRKGPDFHSRLDASFDVLGPNQRERLHDVKNTARQRQTDAEDVCTPLRRALIIRAKLGVAPKARLDFDADLLSALLEIPKYRHGARSLEKLLLPFKSNGDEAPIRRSTLPPPAQLAMHVDPSEFDIILRRNTAFLQPQIIAPLAPAIHNTWRNLSKKEGWKMQPDFDKPYADLGEVEKQENRAAARRIPEILALAGLRVEKGKRAGRKLRDEIRQQLEHHLERLAEAEHDGWMQHRLKNGWHYAETRDDKKKQHPALVPYAKLPEADKAKDRNSVRHFPAMVDLAGYRIVWT